MLRALLLLISLALIVVAAIPVAGDLAGVGLMGPPSQSAPDAPRVLLNNNFVVSLFWALGWLTLALICAAAAVGLDQQARLLRLYRQLDRRLEEPGKAAKPAPETAAARRPAARRRFEPRLAAEGDQRPQQTPDAEERPPRGPVLRADR